MTQRILDIICGNTAAGIFNMVSGVVLALILYAMLNPTVSVVVPTVAIATVWAMFSVTYNKVLCPIHNAMKAGTW